MTTGNTNDGKATSPASAGSHNTHMATARLSAGNTWLQEEIRRLRLTDEERSALEFCIATSERDIRGDIVVAARAAVARLGGGR